MVRALSPPSKPGVSWHHLVQLRGALMRRHDRRDGVRRPRALSQQGTRAASELLPGPLRVPARSWLIARPHHPEKPVGLSDRMMRDLCRQRKARPGAEPFEETPRNDMRFGCAEAAPCAQVARSAVAHPIDARVARREAPARSRKDRELPVCAFRRAVPLASRVLFDMPSRDFAARR